MMRSRILSNGRAKIKTMIVETTNEITKVAANSVINIFSPFTNFLKIFDLLKSFLISQSHRARRAILRFSHVAI